MYQFKIQPKILSISYIQLILINEKYQCERKGLKNCIGLYTLDKIEISQIKRFLYLVLPSISL